MSPEDAVAAFERHATSKIRTKEDLLRIGTLGFRGEALAAIAAVSRMTLFTKRREDFSGVSVEMEGGELQSSAEAGCPDGTTFIVRDIFFNTPARMKFLKKDFTEAGYVLGVVQRAALSHPEIAFQCIRDGKTVFASPGSGELFGAVYSVFGRELAQNLEPAPEITQNGVTVSGYISKPFAPRSNRSMQYFFVNGRYIKSVVVQAAMEESYRNKIISGKYPYGVLCITLPLDMVDVNVHPAKTEVKFAREREVFSAVYSCCKNALEKGENIPDIDAKEHRPLRSFREDTVTKAQETMPVSSGAGRYETAGMPGEPITAKQSSSFSERAAAPAYRPDVFAEESLELYSPKSRLGGKSRPEPAEALDLPEICSVPTAEERPLPANLDQTRENDLSMAARAIGECFHTYILAEDSNGLLLIDKHAAHERMLFNTLRRQEVPSVQTLLSPAVVTLSKEETSALCANLAEVRQTGFDLESFGENSFIIRGIPAYLDRGDLDDVISDIAGRLLCGKPGVPDQLDDFYHSIACKAAIKGGQSTSLMEMQSLCDRVLSDPEVMACPHGRPVVVRLTKYELDKLFKRVNQ